MTKVTLSLALIFLFTSGALNTEVYAQGEETKIDKQPYVEKHKKKVFPEPISDKSLVYFVRPAFIGFAAKMWGFVDDELVATTFGKTIPLPL